MGTKFDLSFTCQDCNVVVPTIKLIRAKSQGQCLRCESGRWTIDGVFEKIEKDYHLAQNAVGLGLAVVTGIGFSKGPSTSEFSRRVHLTDIDKEQCYTFLKMRSHEARFTYLMSIAEERHKVRVQKYEELCGTHAVHCFECHDSFLPGTILAIENLIAPEQYTHNAYCSVVCQNKHTELDRQRSCKLCTKNYLEPSETSHRLVGPRPWHKEGFCSSACQKAKDQNSCKVCKKPYKVSKLNYLPIHAKIIALQKDGFCTPKCHEKADTVSEKPVTKEIRSGREVMKVACDNNHETEVPPSHHGLYYFCFECKTPKAVPA